MKLSLTLLLFVLSLPTLLAQEKKIEVSVHGYLGLNVTHDSHTSSSSRYGHVYRYPVPNNGASNRQKFDISAAHSRLIFQVKGAEFAGYTPSAYIEADFLGSTTDAMLRLRHAYMTFDGAKFSLLAGQAWHPVTSSESMPTSILNNNAGAPVHSLNRNPQIRLTWKTSDKLQLIASVVDQHLSRSSGFADGAEQSGVPEINLQAKFSSGKWWATVLAGSKQLAIPTSLEATKNPVNVTHFHYSASMRYRAGNFTAKAGALYGDNLSEHTKPGGMGKTAANKYIPLRSISTWIDLNSLHKKTEIGVLAGCFSNMGASEKIDEVVSGISRDASIKDIYVVSPRVKYFFTPQIFIGIEYLMTLAQWGEDGKFDNYGIPQNVSDVTNHRFLFSMRYVF